MQGESFLHFGERIAREIGATFKISNDVAILAKRNGGRSASGQPLAIVQAAYGDNLISWDIAPVTGRPRYSKAKTRYYDKKLGTWKTEDVEIEDDNADAEFTSRYPAGDADEAKRNSESRKADSERGKGEGSITIDGNSDAQPEGTVVLSGSRPGIDGTYRIDTVQHDFSRSTGWVTRLDIKQPHGNAGKDSRKKTNKSRNKA
jgi:phage protein D